MQSWDVVIVGGGMVGLSTAYQLARMGTKTLLLQSGQLGGGTSSANAGRAQVNEGQLDPLNIQIIRDGLERLETLEEELGAAFEWHRLGYLCLIDSQSQWDEWQHRAAVLSAGGIPTEVIDAKSLHKAEPHLNMEGWLGAGYSVEGLLNPFLFCKAFADAARRHGATLIPHSPVTGMTLEKGRIRSVSAGANEYAAGVVAVMCGAWTPAITALAGANLPIHHTHAEAFVTEPLPHLLNNTLGLADFYEIIHGKERAIPIGVGPHHSGALLVTEAVAMTSELHQRSSAWGVGGLAQELNKLFPTLSKVKVTRAWGSPTPFTPDDNPAVGWVPPLDNLFVGACLLETITSIPLLSEWMARMIRHEEIPLSLHSYSPARFVN
jgi:sarcosine oxidase subunit beta